METTSLPAAATGSGTTSTKLASKDNTSDLFAMLLAAFQGQMTNDPTAALAVGGNSIANKIGLAAQSDATVKADSQAEGLTPVVKLKAWLTQNWPKDQPKPSDAELTAMAISVLSQPNWLQQMPNAGELQAELQEVGNTHAGLAQLPQYAKGLEQALANLPNSKTELLRDDTLTELAQSADDKGIGTDKTLEAAASAVIRTPNQTSIKAASDKIVQQKLAAHEQKLENKPSETLFGVLAANENRQNAANGQQAGANADHSSGFELLQAVQKALNNDEKSTEGTQSFASDLSDVAANLGFMAPAERAFDPTSKLTLAQATNSNLYSQIPKLQDPNAASMALSVYLQRGVAAGQDQTFNVKLHPEELGGVEVRLKFTDGKMRAHITAEKEDTLRLLKGDSDSLSDALRQAGVSTDANSLSFSLHEGQQQANQGQSNKNNNRFAEAFAADNELSAPIQLIAMPKMLAPGRVDKAI